MTRRSRIRTMAAGLALAVATTVAGAPAASAKPDHEGTAPIGVEDDSTAGGKWLGGKWLGGKWL